MLTAICSTLYVRGRCCCAGPRQGCGNLLNLTDSGPLTFNSTDVDADGQYEPDLECVWTIIATGNTIVSVQFSSFALDGDAPACPDYVEVRSTTVARMTNYALLR